jgi:hypothetical protein
MSQTSSKEMEYEIGYQGILRKHEDSMIKLYASQFLTEKMCNTEHGTMGESNDQSVYPATLEYRGAILSPLARDLTIENMAKYGMRKQSVGLVI